MKLRDYQQDIVNKVFESFKEGQDVSLVVASTASGKTCVFSAIIQKTKELMPDVRVLVIVPRINLVEQTRDKLADFVSQESVGIYCASLGIKDTSKNIIIGTIQSLRNMPELKFFNIVIVDEAHRCPDDSSFMPFYEKLKRLRPQMKTVGFTATPFDIIGGFWGQPIVNVGINKLTEEGYLVPMRFNAGGEKTDLTGVKITAGDYNQKDLEYILADEEKVDKQIADALPRLGERKKVVWICTTIKHAEMVHYRIPDMSTLLHSKLSKGELKEAYTMMTSPSCKHVVSVMMLSEGFDYPLVDAIVMIRPTRSATLFVQAAGRGLRLAEGKDDCLFLDYGRIVENLGTIYDLANVDPKQKQRPKECVACGEYNPRSAKECKVCGNVFVVNCMICKKAHNYGTACCKVERSLLDNTTEAAGVVAEKVYQIDKVIAIESVSNAGNEMYVCIYTPVRIGDPTLKSYIVKDNWATQRNLRFVTGGDKIPDDIEELNKMISKTKAVTAIKEKGFLKLTGIIFQ